MIKGLRFCPQCHCCFKKTKDRNKYCSRVCSLKNFKHTKKHSKEAKKKMRLAKLGKRISPATEFKSGKKNPYEKQRIKSLKRGSEHHNWKGGVTKENEKIRKSLQYKSWRTAVFERDDYTCRGCGKKGVYLEAHHIKPFAEYKDLRFTVRNGITYCQSCHFKNDLKRGRFYA